MSGVSHPRTFAGSARLLRRGITMLALRQSDVNCARESDVLCHFCLSELSRWKRAEPPPPPPPPPLDCGGTSSPFPTHLPFLIRYNSPHLPLSSSTPLHSFIFLARSPWDGCFLSLLQSFVLRGPRAAAASNMSLKVGHC